MRGVIFLQFTINLGGNEINLQLSFYNGSPHSGRMKKIKIIKRNDGRMLEHYLIDQFYH